jgi:hypothetical protein
LRGDHTEKRSLVLDVLTETAKNLAMGLPPVRSWRLNSGPRAGEVFEQRDEQLERYAFQAVRSLTGALGSVEGLDIVEVGPGDVLTSGLSLLAAGANSYTVIDRFIGNYQKPEAKRWYRAVHQAWPRVFPQQQWPKYLQADAFPERYPERVEILSGAVEETATERKYDVLCSYQVGEHVTDIESFAELNARLLKPNGIGVHRIDFSAHAIWARYADPLTFLRFPEWLWSLMGSNRGLPNRRRHHEFCAAFERAGLKTNVTDLEFYPDETVKNARLAKRFQGMPYDSLKVGAAVFICSLESSKSQKGAADGRESG